MSSTALICARCTEPSYSASGFCSRCGLPLGATEADADAATEALGPYEAPEASDPDIRRALRQLVDRAGYDASPAGHGWRLDVPLRLDRKQAVYLGHVGTDAENQPILAFVSVCGPANVRDARSLLLMNARSVEGYFAIRVLRGEEYFVVMRALRVDHASTIDPHSVIRRIAEMADGLEDRLSRGRDIY
jgi:hypothetical protein